MPLPSTAARPATRTPPPPIAVTLGDPAGIGPDIILLGWREREAHALLPFAVYGSADVLRERAQTLGLDAPVVAIRHIEEAAHYFPDAVPVIQPAKSRDAGAAHRGSRARRVGDSVLATGPGRSAPREQQVPMPRRRVPAEGGWVAPGAPPRAPEGRMGDSVLVTWPGTSPKE